MNWARVEDAGQSVKFTSSYDRVFINDFKSQVPQNKRKPVYANGKFSHWLVDKSELGKLEGLVDWHFNIKLQTSHLIQGFTASQSYQRMLRVEYIGQIKERDDGTMSAYGMTTDLIKLAGKKEPLSIDSWSIVFPEDVLKKWFLGGNQSEKLNISTYYSLLNVPQSASQKEVKTAWRKMLMRFHPDYNKDGDAAQMTIKINDAYNILRNPKKRKLYDVGLQMEASLLQTNKPKNSSDFSLPIRCGFIMATGHESAGRFIVESIDQWVDIVEGGKTMVSSWDIASNNLRRVWI